jgi:hypothetical protein
MTFGSGLIPDGAFDDMNWYVRGNPPMVDGVARPDLVDFVCERPIDPRIDDPRDAWVCHLTATGKRVYGERPSWDLGDTK